jgi:hypothetical protein
VGWNSCLAPWNEGSSEAERVKSKGFDWMMRVKIGRAIRERETVHSHENFLCWYVLKTKDARDEESNGWNAFL